MRKFYSFSNSSDLYRCAFCLLTVVFLHFSTALHAKASGERYPIGMNLNGISDWSTEMPFLNLVKQARPWISQRRGASWGKGGNLELDKNGWVRALKPGQWADLIFLTIKQPLIFKEYVVMYEGEGAVHYTGVAKKIRRLGNGRDLIKLTGRLNGYAILSIRKTNPDNYIRNISIVPKRYLSEYESGEVFNPLWLDFIKKFYALRFMDWMKTNNSSQEKWEERPKVNDFSWATKGVPLEVMARLINKTGAEPWFNMPHKANTNYMRNFAMLAKKLIKKNIAINVEHSNEVWNWRFQQTHHAKSEAERLWKRQGNHFMQWQGMRTAIMCDVWKTVFSDNKKRIRCVLGIHPGWRGLEYAALECPSWVAVGNKPCVKHGIDVLAITGYFTGCLDGNAGWKKPSRVSTIRSWFMEKDGGLKKAYLQTDHEAYFSCSGSLTSLKKNYAYFSDVAKKYNLHLYAYEGGQHITGNGREIQDDELFVRFHMKLNRSEYMFSLTKKNLELWKSAGGSLFMYYNDLYPPSKWGSWGSMDNLLDTDSPKIRAIRSFSQEQRCWWSGC